MLRLCVAAATLGLAAGHGLMTTPAPRAGTTNAGGNKGTNVGPCGTNTGAAGAPRLQAAAGGATTIGWRIDAAHGGDCTIRYAPGAGATQGAFTVLAGPFPCAQAGGAASRQVTLPANARAGEGTIQWQWNGDEPYYDCSDIRISANAVGDGALDLNDDTPKTCQWDCGEGVCDDGVCDCPSNFKGQGCKIYFSSGTHTSSFRIVVVAKEADFDGPAFAKNLAKMLTINEARVEVVDYEENEDDANRLDVDVKIYGEEDSNSDEPEPYTTYGASMLLLQLQEENKLNVANVGYNVAKITPQAVDGFPWLFIFITLCLVGAIVWGYANHKDEILAAGHAAQGKAAGLRKGGGGGGGAQKEAPTYETVALQPAYDPAGGPAMPARRDLEAI